MSTHSQMPAAVVYVTTEPADYFQGWPAHYYTVSPTGTTGDIKRRLLRAIGDEEVFIDEHPAPPEFYAELEASVHEMFDGLDLSRTWYGDDEELNAEVQSHFGILMGRWADWVPPEVRTPEMLLAAITQHLTNEGLTTFAKLAACSDLLRRAGYIKD